MRSLTTSGSRNARIHRNGVMHCVELHGVLMFADLVFKDEMDDEAPCEEARGIAVDGTSVKRCDGMTTRAPVGTMDSSGVSSAAAVPVTQALVATRLFKYLFGGGVLHSAPDHRTPWARRLRRWALFAIHAR